MVVAVLSAKNNKNHERVREAFRDVECCLNVSVVNERLPMGFIARVDSVWTVRTGGKYSGGGR